MKLTDTRFANVDQVHHPSNIEINLASNECDHNQIHHYPSESSTSMIVFTFKSWLAEDHMSVTDTLSFIRRTCAYNWRVASHLKHSLRLTTCDLIEEAATPILQSVYQKPICLTALRNEASWSRSSTPHTTRTFIPKRTGMTSPRLVPLTFKTRATMRAVIRKPSTHAKTPNASPLMARSKSLHVRRH